MLRLVVACDADSCEETLPVKFRDPKDDAEAAGWTLTAAVDLCPACSRAAKEPAS